MTELRALSAADFFTANLAYETDPSDVAAARASAQKRCCSTSGTRRRGTRAAFYCWRRRCNGSTKAAFALSRAGHRPVREMIGGFEYWVLTAPVPSAVLSSGAWLRR